MFFTLLGPHILLVHAVWCERRIHCESEELDFKSYRFLCSDQALQSRHSVTPPVILVLHLIRHNQLSAHGRQSAHECLDLIVHLVPLRGELLHQWWSAESTLRWIAVLEHKFQNAADIRSHFFNIYWLPCLSVLRVDKSAATRWATC